MGLLDALSRAEIWEAFYQYKVGLTCPKQEEKRLRGFIDRRAWTPVCESLKMGKPFPLPRRAVISKLHSGKKRVVYTYPEPENTVLKLLTWLLLRRYDSLFSPGLYSFRPGRTAKDAIRALRSVPRIQTMYAYKVDISNYFNSIDLHRFLPVLESAVADDSALFQFLRDLLLEPNVRDGADLLTEQKGIMAGTPLSAFYANLYLRELDRVFSSAGIPYARYSDDIILFSPTEEAMQLHAARLRAVLTARRRTTTRRKPAGPFWASAAGTERSTLHPPRSTS